VNLSDVLYLFGAATILNLEGVYNMILTSVLFLLASDGILICYSFYKKNCDVYCYSIYMTLLRKPANL